MPQRFVKLPLWLGALTAIVLLAAWPSGVGADETTIPPETHWTPTPPAPGSFDSRQLAEFLVARGMLSAQDMAELQQSTEQASGEGSREHPRAPGCPHRGPVQG